MSVPFSSFLAAVMQAPPLLITVLLTLGVVFVNGWTDAPNAIATCVTTRCLPIRSAVMLATVCNVLGVVVMSRANTAVAFTIYQIADFGQDSQTALAALCAAMTAIVIWATAAWYFGIPTSESHALIAGLSGAALALAQGTGIQTAQWGKVLLGLICSILLSFLIGRAGTAVIAYYLWDTPRQKSMAPFRGLQILAAAANAFMHGAQDGQKFIGVFLLGISLAGGQAFAQAATPLWLMLGIALVMGLGTAVGGKKIIKSIGQDMVPLEAHNGFAADVASALSLLLLTLFGIPVSTTHTKTAAVLGTGSYHSLRQINIRVVLDMVLAWICTFPGCGLIGWGMAKLFISWLR